MKKLFSVLLLILFIQGATANEVDDMIKKQSIEVEFLIIDSTKDYNEAKQFLYEASKKLNIRIDLRGLTFHKSNHLTHDKDTCKNYGGYPCYLPRGRYDDGEYLSIEHTNSYDSFTDGYYIVVASSGNSVKKSSLKVKSILKQTYIKKENIYMGSMY